MKTFLTFAGAVRTVTGSKYLLQNNGHRVLVDCGLFQGLKQLRLKNWEPLPIAANSLSSVVLTHAHLDHSGHLPLLVKQGFHSPIYCTPATERLCQILLPDAARLQEEEAEYANAQGFSKHHPALPLYTRQDAERALELFRPIAFGEKFEAAPGFLVSYSRAGHILGAATVKVRVNGKVVVFSGDLGRSDDLLMRAPDPQTNADYVMVESTYGARLHEDVDPLSELARVVNHTYKKGGVLLIPAFAVGRAQTLLYALHILKRDKKIPELPIYLNSPMAIDATDLLHRFREDHKLTDDQCKGACGIATYVRDAEQSEALNRRSTPMILIAASGMATGGRVLHHIKAFGTNSKHTILFTGFQAAGTRGAAMVAGEKAVKIHGEMVPIEAEVLSLDCFSAHADQQDLIQWLATFKRPPKKIYITHGELSQAEALKSAVKEQLDWDCDIPDYKEQIEL